MIILKRWGLLGVALLCAGALTGCVGESTDSDVDETVGEAQSDLVVQVQPADRARSPQIDLSGSQFQDPEPSPWQPPTMANASPSDPDDPDTAPMASDPGSGGEPEPSPWKVSHEMHAVSTK